MPAMNSALPRVGLLTAFLALGTLAAGRGRATAWEIWQSLFPKADPVTQMSKRMLMVIGGLDVLEDAGRAVPSRRDDGVITYQPA